jgi:UDP-N-acetylmuramoyl-L-alanyl-D-glutamate--2,6-diaminopimelate ligase
MDSKTSAANAARESGRVVRELSDHVILTTGSAPGDARIPRLLELVPEREARGSLEIVLDRAAAIRRAVELARPRDVVAVLGIGALKRLIVDAAGTICPHDDREAARAALRSLAARS